MDHDDDAAWDAAFASWRGNKPPENSSQGAWDDFLNEWEEDGAARNPPPAQPGPAVPEPRAKAKGRPRGYTGGLLGMAILRRASAERNADNRAARSPVEAAREARSRNAAVARLMQDDPDDPLAAYLPCERSEQGALQVVEEAGSLLHPKSVFWELMQGVGGQRLTDLALAGQCGVTSDKTVTDDSAEALFLAPGPGIGIFGASMAFLESSVVTV